MPSSSDPYVDQWLEWLLVRPDASQAVTPPARKDRRMNGTMRYDIFFDDGTWTESILQSTYPAPCGDTWFNDPEADHVHRCSASVPHDDYHKCGHTRGDIDGTPTLCGVQW